MPLAARGNAGRESRESNARSASQHLKHHIVHIDDKAGKAGDKVDNQLQRLYENRNRKCPYHRFLYRARMRKCQQRKRDKRQKRSPNERRAKRCADEDGAGITAPRRPRPKRDLLLMALQSAAQASGGRGDLRLVRGDLGRRGEVVRAELAVDRVHLQRVHGLHHKALARPQVLLGNGDHQLDAVELVDL